ncbi:MAG: asparagine synthase-related protein [Candidatus Hodarchaeota archaeon]
MTEIKSSPFGLKIQYYFKSFTEMDDNLSNLVAKNGFNSFSPEGISSYFTFRFPIGNLTMFKDYFKIPCGSELKNDEIQTYWYPKFYPIPIKLEEALKKIEEILFAAIKNLLEGKDKFGFAMSGGVDSSLIVALCRKLYPDIELYTYSAGFYGEDEFEYSRLIAKKLNTIHTEKILYKDDYIGKYSLLAPLIRYKGEPLHPNELALGNIEKIAKKDGCDIVLCGEGADDIFGGYGQNFRMYLNYKKDVPFFRFFLDNYRYFSIEDKEYLLKNEYNINDYEILMNALNEKEFPGDIKNYVAYFTQKIHTIGLITRGVNAMRYNGFPPGFPYINMDLVNFVNSLPFKFKIKWKSKNSKEKAKGLNFRDISENYDIPKFILKKLAEKYLPHKVIYRPKYGFPVPFDFWFEDLKDWNLDDEIFKTNDISRLSGWKKFMIINLNTFFNEFRN